MHPQCSGVRLSSLSQFQVQSQSTLFDDFSNCLQSTGYVRNTDFSQSTDSRSNSTGNQFSLLYDTKTISQSQQQQYSSEAQGVNNYFQWQSGFALLPENILANGVHSPLPESTHSRILENEYDEKSCGLKYWLNKARNSNSSETKAAPAISSSTDQPSLTIVVSTPQQDSVLLTKPKVSRKRRKEPTTKTFENRKRKSKSPVVSTFIYNSVSVQVNLSTLGDLQSMIDNLFESMKSKWRTKLLQIHLDEERKTLDNIYENLRRPSSRQSCLSYAHSSMESVFLSVQYALSYQLQNNDSQISHVYAKYENHLKDIGKDFDWTMQHFCKAQMDPRCHIVRHVGVLAIIASRACLCTELFCSWNADMDALALHHLITTSTSKKMSGSTGGKQSDMTGSSADGSSSANIALGTFPSIHPSDNPASNASHDTHQESPASTISYFSSGGSSHVHNSISHTSYVSLPNGMLSTLRVKEYGVRSTEIWDFYSEKRKALLSESHAMAAVAQKFDELLKVEFPWGLDISSARFREDCSFVLSFLESIVTVMHRFVTDDLSL